MGYTELVMGWTREVKDNKSDGDALQAIHGIDYPPVMSHEKPPRWKASQKEMLKMTTT